MKQSESNEPADGGQRDYRGVAALAFLTIVWGSTFSLVTLALRDFSPVQIVASRLLIGALSLLPLALLTRQSMRGLLRHWRWLLLISVVNYTLPFVLVASAQQTVPSSMTAVFMSAIPLFTLALSRLMLGEPVSARRWLGFGMGLAGLLWLTGADVYHAPATTGLPWPQLGLLLACVLFAVSSIVIRRMPKMPSLPATAIMLMMGGLLLLPLGGSGALGAMVSTVTQSPALIDPALIGLSALLLLAIFPTALGQFMRTFTIQNYGPVFFSIVGYLVPVWATLLGVMLLSEQIRIDQLAAFGVILTGLLLARDGGFQSSQSS